ncbi:hypothetical protein [Microbacterium maritypicum]
MSDPYFTLETALAPTRLTRLFESVLQWRPDTLRGSITLDDGRTFTHEFPEDVVIEHAPESTWGAGDFHRAVNRQISPFTWATPGGVQFTDLGGGRWQLGNDRAAKPDLIKQLTHIIWSYEAVEKPFDADIWVDWVKTWYGYTGKPFDREEAQSMAARFDAWFQGVGRDYELLHRLDVLMMKQRGAAIADWLTLTEEGFSMEDLESIFHSGHTHPDVVRAHLNDGIPLEYAAALVE